jgi:hypothetical protein
MRVPKYLTPERTFPTEHPIAVAIRCTLLRTRDVIVQFPPSTAVVGAASRSYEGRTHARGRRYEPRRVRAAAGPASTTACQPRCYGGPWIVPRPDGFAPLTSSTISSTPPLAAARSASTPKPIAWLRTPTRCGHRGAGRCFTESIEVLIATVEAGSFTTAARKLGVTATSRSTSSICRLASAYSRLQTPGVNRERDRGSLMDTDLTSAVRTFC